MDTVRFYFDPICPWCYQASRWAKRLEELGEIELDWGLFSLEVVNLKNGDDPHQLQARSGPALRTATTVDSQPRLGSPTPIRDTYNIAPLYPGPTHNDEYVAEQLGWGDWYFSPTADARSISPGHLERATLREVSLVQNPANINLAPVRWLPIDIADGYGPPADWSWPWKDTWKRACERVNHHGYRYNDRLLIDDLDGLNPVDECITTDDTAALAAFAKSRLAPRATLT